MNGCFDLKDIYLLSILSVYLCFYLGCKYVTKF